MDTEDLIRERAYLLWEAAGRPEGSGEEFWFAAAGSIAATAGPAPAAAAPAEKPAAKATVRRQAGSAVSSRTGAKAAGGAVATALTSIDTSVAPAAMLRS
jgi:hypothetical protein